MRMRTSLRWKLLTLGGFCALIPKGVKSICRQGLPDKTEVFLAIKNIPAVQNRDLIRLAIPPEENRKYINELRSDKKFYSDFFARISLAKEAEENLGGYSSIPVLEFIYAIVRYSQPEVVVETGVGGGGTTSFILKALDINGKGSLYSIDLPGFYQRFCSTAEREYSIQVPNGWEVGWLVPPELRAKWTLVLGDAKLELPNLLQKLGTIDLFLHDSLHTYEHGINRCGMMRLPP